MKKTILIAVGLVLVGLAGIWRFGVSSRWTQRLPAGWSFEASYIGIQTSADPKTQRIPEKDETGSYQHSIRILSEADRPSSVTLEDRYLVREVNTGKNVFEYVYHASVDPRTGAHFRKEYQGEYFVFPRNLEKKTYKLRFSYLKGIALSFQGEEEIENLNTYLFSYRGRGEYTESFAGTEEYPGLKFEPGQEVQCLDDQFVFKAWVEPLTGEIVKVEEGCKSGDYVSDVATGRPLYPLARWSGVMMGDDIFRRAEFTRRERGKYLWAALYLPCLFLSTGALCLGVGVFPKKSLKF